MLYIRSWTWFTMSTDINTEPGTEENLRLDSDPHPFDAVHRPPSAFHPVLVDGIRGTAAVGSLGGYSTRIALALEEEHPDLGHEFATKYFMINTPGVVEWGHDGKSFTIEKIIEVKR
jgi:hypothetical protein